MKQLRFKWCYTAEDVCKFANTSGVMNKNNEWISVDDELPPYETDILALCDVGGMQLVLIVSMEFGDGERWFSPVGFNGVDTENTVEVTHWQFLPKNR